MSYNYNLSFIQRAKSKDETRFNLCSVFRDTDTVVATDGHRLHFHNVETIETPFFIESIGCSDIKTYPDYKRVLPTTSPQASYSLIVNRDTTKLLKLALPLCKHFDRSMPCLFSFGKDGIILSNIPKSKVQFMITLPCEHVAGIETSLVCQLNLQYFIDGLLDGIAIIDLWDNCNPIVIKNNCGNALIMPMKIETK